MSEWETFCDLCYYDLWRVRRKNERGFNDGYHIHNGDEARALVELLNSLERDIAGWETKWKCAVEMAAIAENERDELKEKLDAQELEMFAIRSSLSDAKAEIEEIQEQLNAYIMLDKMAMRKFIREREQERQQCRQSPTTNQ